MTTTMATGVCDIMASLPVHDQLKDYDSTVCLLHKSAPSSSTDLDYDNVVERENLHNTNNNNHNNNNSDFNRNRHQGYKQYKRFGHHPINGHVGVKVTSSRRRRVGSPTNDLSSDYDNVTPAATATSAAARLSRVEEEAGGGDGSEQQPPSKQHEQRSCEFDEEQDKSYNTTPTVQSPVNGDGDNENQILSDPRDNHPVFYPQGLAVNGDAEQHPILSRHDIHTAHIDRNGSDGGDAVCDSHVNERVSASACGDSAYAGTTTTTKHEEQGEGAADEKINSTGHQSQGIGGEVDNVELEPGANGSVSALSDSVGSQEGTLSNGNELGASDNRNNNEYHGSTTLGLPQGDEDDCCTFRCEYVSPNSVKLDGLNCERKCNNNNNNNNNNNSDCDDDVSGSSRCDSDGNGCSVGHVDNVSHVISNSPERPIDKENSYDGNDDAFVEGSDISNVNDSHKDSTITVDMGASQSRRSKVSTLGDVAYDHSNSRIEMKEYSKNNGDCSVSLKSSGFDPIHGEMIDDENRSLSLDSYQTIPEYPEEYNKMSHNASFGDAREKVPLFIPSCDSDSQQIVPGISRANKLQVNELDDSVSVQSSIMGIGERLEVGKDGAPIYAVVNKKKTNVSGVPSPQLVDDSELMDGDYSVPSWVERQAMGSHGGSGDLLKSEIVSEKMVAEIGQGRRNPNIPREHKETVSASVSVSSLASSHRHGSVKAASVIGVRPYRNKYSKNNNRSFDDEYDDVGGDVNSDIHVTGQMKKSSTTENVAQPNNNWRGSLKFPRSRSTTQDYFSLGRRPKVRRSQTLVDAHGKAVSMDTLLKARRHGSVPETKSTLDNLSVEDILKSCEDFDASKDGFRSRAESATSVTSYNLKFFVVREVSNENGCADEGLNNLNSPIPATNESTSPTNSPSDQVQTMNIVNDEDVELRPRVQNVSVSKNVTLSPHSTVVSNDAVSTSIPPHSYNYLTTNKTTVQCMINKNVVSNASDLTTPLEVPSSTNHIPSNPTTPQVGGRLSTTSPYSLSSLSSPSPSSSSSSSPPYPTSQKSYNAVIIRNGNSQATKSPPPSYQSCYQPTSITHVSTNHISTTKQPTQQVTSITVVPSPDIKVHPDHNSNNQETPSTKKSPLSGLSDSVFFAPRPKSLSSLTVDVTSPVLEGSTSQNSSPALRSPNSIAKLEAVEAIKWLRAAGFPQYAQMFDDGSFPIELALVEKDHDFLDKDSIQSLFRRLETLNKYAGMKIDAHQRKKAASEDDEEDDICALSERWEYQKSVRRWSRKDLGLSPRSTFPTALGEQSTRGSHDSLLADQDNTSQTGDSPLLNTRMPHKEDMGVQCEDEQVVGDRQGPEHQQVGGNPISPRLLRRAASERIKTAKILWKKMEGGLKSKKSRRHPRNIKDISDPIVADQENMQAKLQRLNCVDISPSSEQVPNNSLPSSNERVSSPTSTQPPQSSGPLVSQQVNLNQPSQKSQEGDGHLLPFRSRFTPQSQSVRERPTYANNKDQPDNASSDTIQSTNTQPNVASSSTDSSLKEYYTAQSQLLRTLELAHPSHRSNSFRKQNNDSGLREIFLLPQDHQPGKFPRLLQNGYIETEIRGIPSNSHHAREHGYMDTPDRLNSNIDPTTGNRDSVYDNFSTSSEGAKRLAGITDKSSRSLSEIHEDDSKSTNVSDGSHSQSGLYRNNESSDRSFSFDSCNVDARTDDKSSYRELKDKILKEASSPSLPLSETKGGVSHSISVDSYLRDNDNSSHRRNSGSSSIHSRDTTCSDVIVSDEKSLSDQYDEFDLILREMYANINDLTRRVGESETDPTQARFRVQSERGPAKNSTNSSTTTTTTIYNIPHDSSSKHSSSSHKQRPTLILSEKDQRHQHNGTNVPQDDSEVIPLSPNTDPILSPTSPLSPDYSVDTDGVTDPENENSSSGGGDSHTGESISDPEAGLDLSHDDSLEQIPAMTRERRDSGVGHSLTRGSSDRKRKKLRWHSFQKCHRPDINSRSMQINSLTVGQLVWLQKLSLLKLTGIMEKCLPVNKSGWNWMMPRFMKRNKAPDFSDKNVFGVPLSVMVQRTGQPLPQCVLYAMRYLRRTSQHAVGIFRKSGVKSKIQSLIDHLEANPDTTDFEDMNAYNVADMIKTFFRDLPECLLTNKLSETFRSIYTHVPKSQLLEAIQAAILLLPDENREVLQSLLLFLSDISMHEADHQMNAVNLAVCFTPTVFMLGFKQTMLSHSPKRNRKAAPSVPGVPDPREIMEQKTSQDCLLLMITECKTLFTVPPKLFRQVQTQSMAHKELSPVFELSGEEGTVSEEIRAFGQERVQKVLKDAHDKNRGWVPSMTINNIEISQRKPIEDDCPLKEWKLVVDIDAPPIEVLRRIMHERHAWDEDLLSWSVVERIDPHSDIFQYVLNSMAPHPSRHFCVLRYWRADLSKGACALITMSVDHGDVQDAQGAMAVDYGSFYLMEPCGSGRSRLTHITRMDTRGRCPEWYSKVFGHVVANFVERLRDSFKQETSGPETKV